METAGATAASAGLDWQSMLLDGPHRCQLSHLSLLGGAAVVATAYILLHLAILRWALANLSVQLTEDAVKNGQTQAGYRRLFPNHCMTIINGVIVGLLGLWAAFRFLAVPGFDAGDTVFVRDVAGGVDPLCSLFLASMIGAVLFAGYVFYLNFGLVVGYEDRALDNVVHHLTFLGLTITTLYYGNLFPELGLIAMAMELSTPFLTWYRMCREVKALLPYHDAAALAFAGTFLCVRPGLFTVAILRSISLWFTDPAVFSRGPGAAVPFGVIAATQGFYFLGWLLQLFWSRAVLSKVVRGLLALSAGRSKSKKDQE